jgi:hypothetical protein
VLLTLALRLLKNAVELRRTASAAFRFATMAATISTFVSDDTNQPHSSMDYEEVPKTERPNTSEKLLENDLKWTNGHDWTMLLKLATGGNDDEVNIVKIHKEIFALLCKADASLTIKTTIGTSIESITDFPTGNDYQAKFSIKETHNQFTVARQVCSKKTALVTINFNTEMHKFEWSYYRSVKTCILYFIIQSLLVSKANFFAAGLKIL